MTFERSQEGHIDLEYHCIEDILDAMDELTEEARNMLQNRHLPIEELFTGEFVRNYTPYQTLEDLCEASGFKVNDDDDFDCVPDDQWDAFIANHTDFTEWSEMLQTAIQHWVERQFEVR